jgi:hypothetical protein
MKDLKWRYLHGDLTGEQVLEEIERLTTRLREVEEAVAKALPLLDEDGFEDIPPKWLKAMIEDGYPYHGYCFVSPEGGRNAENAWLILSALSTERTPT